MSYNSKLESAKVLIEKFNTEMPSDNINFDNFKMKLLKLGAIDEDSLSSATFEDIEDCGVPKILARKIANIFRQKNTTPSSKRIEFMNQLELLELYDYKEPQSLITKKLKEISNNKKFIVIINNKVDISLSNKYLDEVKQGFPEREEANVNGEIYPVYSAGEQPDIWVDENPLYPGRPLRPDGTCDQTNRSWDGVSLYVKQLIYLIYKTEEVSFNQVHDIIDLAVSSNAESKLRERFPKKILELQDLLRNNEAPRLKVKLNNKILYNNNPFKVGGKI